MTFISINKIENNYENNQHERDKQKVKRFINEVKLDENHCRI